MESIKTEANFEAVRAANRKLVRARIMQKGVFHDEVDDVEQLVWLQVWKERNREIPLHIRGYLWVKAQDEASKYLHSKYRDSRTVEITDLDTGKKLNIDPEFVPADSETGEVNLESFPDTLAYDPEAMACLMSLVQKLFKPYREALLLWINEHDYDQIAAIMKIGRGTVTYFLSEARRGIAELIKTGKIGPDPRMKLRKPRGKLPPKEFCKSGKHKWVLENLYWDKYGDGGYRCRLCTCARVLARYYKCKS